MKPVLCLILLMLLSMSPVLAQAVWLDELDLRGMEIGWGTPEARKSVEANPLTVAGRRFERGVGTHAVSTFLIHLDGKGKRFTCATGLDDEIGQQKGSVQFYILGDKTVLWTSGVMKKGDLPESAGVDLAGVRLLGLLVTGAGDGIDYDHADWLDARIELKEGRSPSQLAETAPPERYLLTPEPSDTPRINSPKIFGVRPGHPFLFSIAATGKRPMTFDAAGLPDGIGIDSSTGRITGTLRRTGDYVVTLRARNQIGRAEQELRISVGDTICLTPPMGWNSWNSWACSIDDPKVRAAADAMVSSGLAGHGWTYVNIDDCWEVKPGATEPMIQGRPRDGNGMVNTNKKFPDMKALSDYVHGQGLKIGIYSGPGPVTCQGFTASYGYEEQDARRYAEWGIDYLKYDWCSYGSLMKDPTLTDLQRPYRIMRRALDKVPRDIVYSLCQYGMGKVWEWGAEVGGNCWRTTGDIIDTWASVARIGFGEAGHEPYAGRGHWNDPDMLVVGQVGWGPELHPSRLTPDEQYAHISLWCLLSAPLLIGCDLGQLDDFTRNLLSNDEVIGVDQDPLGHQARRILLDGGKQIWVKEMADGSKAVGLFYPDIRERKSPEDYFTWEKPEDAHMLLRASDLGLFGKFRARDLWRQKDLGEFTGQFETHVPFHGVVLLKVEAVR